MVIEEILKEKTRQVARSRERLPLAKLENRLGGLPPTRDFHAALGHRPLAIIAEIKRKSPSRGWIWRGGDPREIASMYQRGGAAAISVLTEERFFGGHPDFIPQAREIVTLPLLRKDFILDPYEIYETRLLGADSLLLIAGLLQGARLARMIDLAFRLGLQPLVEVHDAQELERALDAGATIIGINNRDLRSLRTDIRRTLELAPLVPPSVRLVSESGIRSRHELELLMEAGVRAFLVGSALMEAQDPVEKLLELRGLGEGAG
jgi:indole-3-glycerol phosphate synthase